MPTALRFYAGTVTASTTTRTLAGLVVNYGEYGDTSIGRLRVRAGAFRFPDDLGRVKLIKEHDRGTSRGHLVMVDDNPQRLRISARVADGPEGDEALREAQDRTRDGLSYDIINAFLEGDEIVSADVIAIGQVGIPAYEPSRIDSIAASNPTPGGTMTPEQIARLAALRAQQTRTDTEETEFALLTQLETALTPAQVEPAPGDQAPAPAVAPAAPAASTAVGVPVAASFAPVPPGVPAPARTSPRDQAGALDTFVQSVVDAYASNRPQAITAALGDIVESDVRGIINQPAWSGELWSGLDFVPEFTPLLSSGNLTDLYGEGWRFKTKPEIKDYAGDKAPIETTTTEVEKSPWTAARMAVGNDFDRAFYDFPERYAPVLRGYVEYVRESWAMKLDLKVHDYILANAVPLAGPTGTQPTLLKAAARAIFALKRRKVGAATFVIANDEDWFTLLDLTKDEVPAFLELFNLTPGQIKSSPSVPAGSVIAGVKQTAEVKTLPGSPIRVSAQHLANGGIDEAFFGYWAIEEHHTQGIASVNFTAPVEA